MTGIGALLSIDLWHTHLAAVVRTPQRRIVPVAVDGAVLTPTGVAVTADGTLHPGHDGARIGQQDPHAYLRLPGRHLLDNQLSFGGVTLDPVDVMAALLATVARAAGQAHGWLPADVIISTPARWTARQRQRLRAAAAKAGLGPPRLTTGAESILREQLTHGLEVPVGQVAIICRLAATVGELVLLQRQPDAIEVLAAIDLGELGETPGATLVDQAATALTAAMAAAAITSDQIAAIVSDAAPADLPELAPALAAASGAPMAPIHVGELSAAFGGTRAAGPGPQPGPARPSKHLVGAGITMVGGWAAAAALTMQVLNSGEVIAATTDNPTLLLTQWYAWGLAPVFAILGTVCLALLASERRSTRPGTDPGGPDPTLGAALLITAALGIGAAVVLAMLGAASYGVAPAALLRWTLISSGPLAASVAILGVLVARMPPPGDWSATLAWRTRLRPSLAGVLVAGLATVLLVAQRGGIPHLDPDLWWKTEHLAGYGLGWAVALHLSTDPWRRATIGFLLSAAATYAISTSTDDTIAICLIAAITLWWLVRLAPVARMILHTPSPPRTPQRNPATGY